MNTERTLSAGLAVVAVLAVGLSAATLASSMSTDPGDAVDIDWGTLPLDDDSETAIAALAQGVHDQYSQGGDGDREHGQDDDTDGDQGASGSSSAQRPGDVREGDVERRGDTGPQKQVQEREQKQVQERDQRADSEKQASQSSTGGLVPGGWPLWPLVAVVLCLALVIAAYRYRERLRRALGTGAEPATAAPLAPAPENDVERAWVELLERAGVPQSRTKTPRDCARLAVETGYDPSAVNRLRRTFEDVQYGSQSPTDEQARIARETLARLDGESG